MRSVKATVDVCLRAPPAGMVQALGFLDGLEGSAHSVHHERRIRLAYTGGNSMGNKRKVVEGKQYDCNSPPLCVAQLLSYY